MVQLRDKAGKDELAVKVTSCFFGGGFIKFSPALCCTDLPRASLDFSQSHMIGLSFVFGRYAFPVRLYCLLPVRVEVHTPPQSMSVGEGFA